MRKTVLVIGSGIGGLAIACRLASRGFKVTVLERNANPGGKTMTYQVGKYAFQPAPCMIMRIDALSELFKLGGGQAEDYVQFSRLDPQYRVYYEDGRSGVVRWTENVGPALWFDEGETKPLICAEDSIQPTEIQLAMDLIDPMMVGSALAPGIFTGIDLGKVPLREAIHQQIVFPKAVFHPMGGFQAVVNGLCQVLRNLDGVIQYNSDVEQILTSGNHATGVRLADGQKYYADVIISDADYSYTFTKLLRSTTLPVYSGFRLNQHQAGTSFFSYNYGMKRKIEKLPICHHNFFISKNFSDMIHNVYRANKFSTELFFYLQIPSITDSHLAPDNSSILQILVPVPNLKADVDWYTMFHLYREQIIRIIDETLFPGFQKDIEVELSLTPKDFLTKFNCTNGSTFRGPVSNLEKMTLNRYMQTGISNLFVVGDGTYPGWGIDSVLKAARMVDEWLHV